MMQKRDTSILIIAIACGFLSFILVLNILRNSAATQKMPALHLGNQPISLAIPSSMRALTLSPKEVENIPAPLPVGGYVDILGIAPNFAEKMELQTIVRSAQIINIEKEDKGEVKSLTLAVSPVGAEVVTKARGEGKIHLVLRPEGGEKDVLQLGGMGVVEVIRGVQKQKSMHVSN